VQRHAFAGQRADAARDLLQLPLHVGRREGEDLRTAGRRRAGVHYKEPTGDAPRFLQADHPRFQPVAEVQLLAGVDGDAIEDCAVEQRTQQHAPTAAQVLEAEKPDLPAPAEPCGERRGIGGDRDGAVEQVVPTVAPAASRETGQVLGVDDLELGVAGELEAVAVGARLEGGPEGLGRDTLGCEVAEEAIEGADEVLGAVEPAEDLAAELTEDAAKDDGALEVIAGFTAGAAEAGRELLEGAEGRVEPAGDAALGGEADQVVAQGALAEGQEVRGRGERVLGGAAEGGEECLGGPLQEEEGVSGDDDFERAAGGQSASPRLDCGIEE
jgi:hypothetical protein